MAAADLDGTTYESTAVEGHELVPGEPVRLTFEGDTMSVSAGCNTMFGAFEVTDGTLAWSGEPASSLVGCEPELADQDAWLAELFTTGVEASSDGSTLTLTSGRRGHGARGRGRGEPRGAARAHLDGARDRRGRGHQPGAFRGPQPAARGREAAACPGWTPGCNAGRTTVTVGEDSLTFGHPAVTRQACPGAAGGVEQAVLAVVDGQQ